MITREMMMMMMEKMMTAILRDCHENTSGDDHIWPTR